MNDDSIEPIDLTPTNDKKPYIKDITNLKGITMGTKIISGIDIIDDGLRFEDHGLDCITVVKYQASRAFRIINPDMFYLYLYFYYHYDVLKQAYTLEDSNRHLDNFRSKDIEGYILREKLGLEIISVNIKENGGLCASIQTLLEQDMPVFVPIERGELFYSSIYHQQEEPGMLLIKGYNPKTEVFIIHDFEQNRDLVRNQVFKFTGDVYTQFYIHNKNLEQANEALYQSGSYLYLKGQIQGMRLFGIPTIDSEDEALQDIHTQLQACGGFSESLIESKIAILKNAKNSQMKPLIAYINSQQILIKTLKKILLKYNYNENKIAKIEETGSTAWKAWKNLVIVIGVYKLRGESKANRLDALIGRVLNTEQAFLQAFSSCMEV